MTIEEFRANTHHLGHQAIYPPFIMQTMLVQVVHNPAEVPSVMYKEQLQNQSGDISKIKNITSTIYNNTQDGGLFQTMMEEQVSQLSISNSNIKPQSTPKPAAAPKKRGRQPSAKNTAVRTGNNFSTLLVNSGKK